jgi:hypothetical protein
MKKVLFNYDEKGAVRFRQEMEQALSALNEANGLIPFELEDIPKIMADPETWYRDRWFADEPRAREVYQFTGTFLLPAKYKLAMQVMTRKHFPWDDFIHLIIKTGGIFSVNEKAFEEHTDRHYRKYLTEPDQIKRWDLAQKWIALINETGPAQGSRGRYENHIVKYNIYAGNFEPREDFILQNG